MTLAEGTAVRIYDQEVRLKLLAAAPRILAENRVMVQTMLEGVKSEIEPIPGYRTSLHIDVSSSGVKTTGQLKGEPRAYWRNFGTYGSFVGGSTAIRGYIRALKRQGATAAGGGEAALELAGKALTHVRAYLRFYYGKAQWWRL